MERAKVNAEDVRRTGRALVFGASIKKVPLAPYPRKAMLTTIKAR
jgi:hypothetical protein